MPSSCRKRSQKHGILGSGVVVVSGGEVVAHDWFGIARREPERAVNADTIFHYASITKTLTGIAIMQLRDRGLLDLDDPITKYLPELRQVHNPHGSMDTITIRHLLTHTAGFRAPTWPWKSEPWHPHEPQHWEQLVAMFPYTEVQFAPGSRWSYSNPGIVFLGRVIELLTNDDYEVYIDKNIFKPLGMHRSYFDATPYHLEPHKSHSFTSKAGTIEPADPDVNTGITVSNGGLKAPLGDMALYLQFLLGDPSRQSVYDRVLARASLEEMWRPFIEIPPADPPETGTARMGLCFFLEEHHGVQLVGHSGGQNAFVSHLYLDPKRRVGYLVAYNTLVYRPLSKTSATSVADDEIRDHVVQRLFPVLAP